MHTLVARFHLNYSTDNILFQQIFCQSRKITSVFNNITDDYDPLKGGADIKLNKVLLAA